jgi:peptidoglycan/LPS O-acetylase OafA/YrhL
MKKEIRALTALRGIAAMAVVLQHYSASAEQVSLQAIPSLAPHGYMAVDFFFVLSGFIMSYTYADGFQNLGWREYPDFMARRVARVWPLQAAVVLILVAVGLLRVAFGGQSPLIEDPTLGYDVAANVLMLQGYGIGQNLNGPSSTVSQELGAYVLFPLLLALIFSRRRTVVIAGIGLAAAVVCWQGFQYPGFGLASRGIGNNVARCLAEFTLGIGAFRLFQMQGLRFLSANWFALTLAALCLGSLLLRLDLPAALMFPFLVIAFARNEGWPAKLVASRVPFFLGVVSYSVYLVHSPVRFATFEFLAFLHPARFSGVEALALAGVLSLTTIPIAWVCYRWIERPGRDLFRRLLGAAPSRNRKTVPRPEAAL